MTRDIGLKGLKLLADVAVTDTDDANVDAIPSNQDNNKTPNNAVADKTPHTDTNESTTKKKNVAKKDNAKTPAAYNDKSKTSKYTKDKSTPRTSKQPVDLVLGNAGNVGYEHLSQPVDTPAKEKVLAEHKTLLNFATADVDGDGKDDVDEREDGDDGSHINNGDEEDDEYEYDMDEDQVSYVCQYVLSTLTNVYNLNSFLCY